MKVEFIANASFLIRLKDGSTLLTDPWWSDGIYYGAWYNFPPIPTARLDGYLALKPAGIYISHIHPDHFDPGTLRHFPKTTPILIGRFADPGFTHLRRAVEAVGFSDVRALTLWEETSFGSAKVAVLPQFAAVSAADVAGDDDFELDTSLWVRDADGTTLFNAVDNALHDDAAREVVERLGRPDVAILPYAGASFFPQGCPAYSDERKAELRDQIGERRLSGFIRHAGIMGAKHTVPAAGTFVLGGRLAPGSRYLHQATPSQIEGAWREAGFADQDLSIMSCGDVLDTETGGMQVTTDAPFRSHTAEERWAYAEGLCDRSLPHDEIVIPSAFRIPWTLLLGKAAETMRKAAQTMNLAMAYDVEILVRPNTVVSTPKDGVLYRFALDSGEPSEERRFIRFGADDGLWLMVLVGAAVWNNVEIGSLMTCERTPDTQDPRIHTLMNWFRV